MLTYLHPGCTVEQVREHTGWDIQVDRNPRSWSATGSALCAVVSCFGCLNGWLLIGCEPPRGDGRRRSTAPLVWGAQCGGGAPAQSILLGSVITTLLTMMAYTRTGVAADNFAALLSTATNLVLYLFCALAVVCFIRDGLVRRIGLPQ